LDLKNNQAAYKGAIQEFKQAHLIPFAKKTKGHEKGSRGWRKSNITDKFTRREKAHGKRVEKNNLGQGRQLGRAATVRRSKKRTPT